MTNYKLTYFDFNGGRAEPIRIAFHIAGVKIEDHRFSMPDFPKLIPSFPFNAVPVLEIDGEKVTQSNAMCRYVGKMAGLYPSNDIQALYCDEVLGVIEDTSNYVVKTFGLEGDALKAARAELVEGRLSVALKGLQGLLKRGGGTYFVDNKFSIADIKVFVQMNSLTSGMLDHIPTDIVESLAPTLAAHQKRIAAEPGVAAYYKSLS